MVKEHWYEFSYAKAIVALCSLYLSWLSLTSQQPVQALVALVTLLNVLVGSPQHGDALMFFPLLFLSERCLQNVMALGHSPLLFYGASMIAHLQVAPLSWASAAVAVTGLSVFSALTLEWPLAVGCFAHVGVGMLATSRLQSVTNQRESVLLGQLFGFFVADAITNVNLESAEKLDTVTSFPYVGGRLALLSAMLVALLMATLQNNFLLKGSSTKPNPAEQGGCLKKQKHSSRPGDGSLKRSILFWLVTSITVGTSYMYATWLFGEDAFVWLWAYLHGSKLRLYSLALWFTGIPIAVLAVNIFGSSAKLVVRRKMFHFIALAAFVYPLVRDPSFMAFSAMVATALGAIGEVARYHRVAGFNAVDRFLSANIDDRDQGAVRTHLYLLFGMVFPAIFRHRLDFVTSRVMPGVAELMLDVVPGLIALGVLDAFAAIAGSSQFQKKHGRMLSFVFSSRIFPVSLNPSLGHKTTVGTAAGILAGCAAWLLLLFVVRAPSWGHPLTAASFAPVVIAGVFEAVTSGVDNLEIPVLIMTVGNILCATILKTR